MKITSIQAPNADFYCENIAAHISQQLELPVAFVTGVPWQERERMIDTGEVEVGWICGLPYIWKIDQPDPSIELLVAAVMEGERYNQQPMYYSDVVVRKESHFKSFDDLRGARWAYNEPNSHSGFSVVRYHLASLGERSGYFGSVIESGSHQRSLEMILDGRIDASAIDSTVLEMEITNQQSIEDQIRVIEILGPSPIPPWVVSRNLPDSLKDSLRTVFLEMHENEAGQAILRGAMISRFVAVSDQDYDPIRKMERLAMTVEAW